MVIFVKVIQFFLALSILIFVHELGHFGAAKLFKVRVDKFYLFFDWGFSLFRCKKVNGRWRFKFFSKNVPEKYNKIEKRNEDGKKEVEFEPIDLNTLPEDDWRRSDSTEYGIGWFPLGGYNKIAGMIDESMDKEQMKQPPKDWEFRSKPAWQRFIIMVAGVFMNVVLAIAIYIGLLSNYGEQYLPTAEVNKYGITVDSLGYEFGLRDGDKILSIDGKTIANFQEIPMQIILEKAKTIEVERDGKDVVVTLPDDALSKLLSSQNGTFISYRMPFMVSGIIDNSAAQAGGLEVGDIIIGINDTPTPYYQDFVKHIKQFKNQDVAIIVDRDFDDYWKQLKLIFNPSTKAYESVGGFISIGKIFPDTWVWSMFWRLTAFLSIALAVMNILPIPALDGGHILFLLYEIITRRKPSDKFMEIAEYIGLILVLALVIFANGNDVIKLFK